MMLQCTYYFCYFHTFKVTRMQDSYLGDDPQGHRLGYEILPIFKVSRLASMAAVCTKRFEMWPSILQLK